MNVGDGLASGAKKASFTTREARKMSKEEWDAMFEPEAQEQVCETCGHSVTEHDIVPDDSTPELSISMGKGICTHADCACPYFTMKLKEKTERETVRR